MKKNLLKSIFMGLAFALCGAMAISNAPVTAKASSSDFDCAISAAPKDGAYMYYGSTDVIAYTAEEAAAAGVPAGYEGQVLEVVGSVSKGVLLDFSAMEIPIGLVKSFDVRFYAETNAANTNGKPQIRIPRPFEPEAWVYQPGSTASVTGEWATETIEKNFSSLANKDGILDKFELAIRTNAKIAFYIDAINVNLYENDGIAPVITYKGEEEVVVGIGSELMLDVHAYDAQEKCNKSVEYIWEDGVALDEKGTPTAKGEYTLTLRAKDYFGNISEKTLNVTVLEPDTQAPVINLTFTEMYVQVGTTPILNVKVTDDCAILEVTKVWSDGALDKYGRLTEGTHTYTVTAIDTSNNKAVKTLTVHVTVDEPTYDNVIDENEFASGCVVTFDGVVSDKKYDYGDKIEKPADPVKEADEYIYTFRGWYNGDMKWDFENDVITGDVHLVSKWLKTPNDDYASESESSEEIIESELESEVESDVVSESQSLQDVTSSVEGSEETSEKEEKKGCFATVGLTASITALLGACAVILKGKKEE